MPQWPQQRPRGTKYLLLKTFLFSLTINKVYNSRICEKTFFPWHLPAETCSSLRFTQTNHSAGRCWKFKTPYSNIQQTFLRQNNLIPNSCQEICTMWWIVLDEAVGRRRTHMHTRTPAHTHTRTHTNPSNYRVFALKLWLLAGSISVSASPNRTGIEHM